MRRDPSQAETGLADRWLQGVERIPSIIDSRRMSRMTLSCPTDLWSYQRVLVEQARAGRRRRDAEENALAPA